MGEGKSWQTLGKLGLIIVLLLPPSLYFLFLLLFFSPPSCPSLSIFQKLNQVVSKKYFLTFSPSFSPTFSLSFPWMYRALESYISIRLHQSLLHYSFAL